MPFPYTPVFRQPGFRQDLPKPADQMELLEGDMHSRVLRYRDPETSEVCVVPNIPANQQSSVLETLPAADESRPEGFNDFSDIPGSIDEFLSRF